MLLHKSVVHDSRVRREGTALARAGHEVTVLELAREGAVRGSLDGFYRRPVWPPAAAKRLLPSQAFRALSLTGFVAGIARLRPDVVHAHDAAMLPSGLAGARLVGAQLVYDSHELATSVPYRERYWARLVAGIERIAVPRAAAVITVSDGIAQRLRELYGLRRDPVVLRNVSDLRPPGPGQQRGLLRARLGIGDGPLILHQGATAEGRGCEALVRAFAHLDQGDLVFLGGGDESYGRRLSDLALAEGVEARVHFAPALPLEELLTHTRDADVGVSLLEDSCENHRLALPNKVFEYLTAGVPVVVSDLPELSSLVRGHRVGWLVDPADPVDIAAGLERALAHRGDPELAGRVAVAAQELTWENEQRRLLDLYAELTGE